MSYRDVKTYILIIWINVIYFIECTRVTYVLLARAKVRDAITVYATFITSRESSRSLLSFDVMRYLGFQVSPLLSFSPDPQFLLQFFFLCPRYYDACTRKFIDKTFSSGCTCTWTNRLQK